MAQYRFIHSSKVSGGGLRQINIGYPIALHMVNDVCLCATGKSEYIPLNSEIVRQALLADPEETYRMFGILVLDGKNLPKINPRECRVTITPFEKKQAEPKQEKQKHEKAAKKAKQEPVVEDLGEITEDEL